MATTVLPVTIVNVLISRSSRNKVNEKRSVPCVLPQLLEALPKISTVYIEVGLF